MTIRYISCFTSDRPYDGLTSINFDGNGTNNDILFSYGHFDNFPVQEIYTEQWIDILPSEDLKFVLAWQQTPLFNDLGVITSSVIEKINSDPQVYLLCVDALESIIYPEKYTEQCKLNGINPAKVVVLTSNQEIHLQKIDNISYITICYWESITRQHHRWLNTVEMVSQSQRIDYIKSASKKFISLNRNLKPARAMWKYAMSQSLLEPQGYVSYQLPKMGNDGDYSTMIEKSSIIRQYFNGALPSDFKDHLEYKQLDSFCNEPISYTDTIYDYVNDSLVSFITESHHETIFLTEKTFKAIAQRQPFFIIGTPKMHSRLRDKGYYTFEKLFGVNQVYTASEAIECCKKLRDRDIEDIRQEILADWMPKIEHNYNLFFNSKCDWDHTMLLVKNQINL
jgi:hypothetical protein